MGEMDGSLSYPYPIKETGVSRKSIRVGKTNQLKTMKTAMKFILGMTVLLMFACGPSAGNKGDKTADTTAIQTEMEDVVEATEAYAEETMGDVNTVIDEMIANIDAEMGKAEEKYESLSAEAKAQFKLKKIALEEQKKLLEEKIAGYNEAAEDQKEELMNEIEKLKMALQESIETLKSQMEE